MEFLTQFVAAFMMLPLQVQLLVGGMGAMAFLALWLTRPNRNLAAQFHHAWIKRIDESIANVRKVAPRCERRNCYKRMFTRLHTELQEETFTSIANFNQMATHEQSIWIYLLTRQRDILRLP